MAWLLAQKTHSITSIKATKFPMRTAGPVESGAFWTTLHSEHLKAGKSPVRSNLLNLKVFGNRVTNFIGEVTHFEPKILQD